jgi:hypothetical protein
MASTDITIVQESTDISVELKSTDIDLSTASSSKHKLESLNSVTELPIKKLKSSEIVSGFPSVQVHKKLIDVSNQDNDRGETTENITVITTSNSSSLGGENFIAEKKFTLQHYSYNIPEITLSVGLENDKVEIVIKKFRHPDSDDFDQIVIGACEFKSVLQMWWSFWRAYSRKVPVNFESRIPVLGCNDTLVLKLENIPHMEVDGYEYGMKIYFDNGNVDDPALFLFLNLNCLIKIDRAKKFIIEKIDELNQMNSEVELQSHSKTLLSPAVSVSSSGSKWVSMFKNTNYQVSRKWQLSGETFLILGYGMDDSEVTMGEIGSSSTPLKKFFKLSGAQFLQLLKQWDDISSAFAEREELDEDMQLFDSDSGTEILVNLGYVKSHYGLIFYDSDENLIYFINSESLSLIAELRTVLIGHLELLRDNYMAYRHMQFTIVEYAQRQEGLWGKDKTVQAKQLSKFLETVTSLDLKSIIVSDFKETSYEYEFSCTFNVYSLFSYCMSRPSSLRIRITENRFDVMRGMPGYVNE